MKICNALPASLFDLYPSKFQLHEVNIKYVQSLELDSCIGHEDLAKMLTELLGKEVAYNRVDSKIQHGESAIIAHTRKKASKDEVKFYQIDVCNEVL